MKSQEELTDKALERVAGGSSTREDEIKAKILNLVKAKGNRNAIKIDCKSAIVNELGADSLDVVDILQTLENEYQITLPESCLSSASTVEDLSSLVLANLKQ